MKKDTRHFEPFIIMLVTLIGIFGAVVFNFLLVIGFLPGFLCLLYICMKNNYSFNEIWKSALTGFMKTREVMIILLLVGVLLPAWKLAGTIDEMVELILSFTQPDFFYLSAFLSALTISMILGTSVGTLSVIGIPIIGSEQSLGLSVEIIAGALVSGAFVGDRTSPFSSANQLLSNILELNRKPFQRILWNTGIFACIVSIIFFLLCDLVGTEHIILNQGGRKELNLVALIPIILLLLLAFLKVKIKISFLVSIIAALLLLYFDKSLALHWAPFWYGTTENGGGLMGMIPLVAFIGLAGAYNGIVEKVGVFQSVLEKWLGRTKSLYTITWKTMLATLFISFIACNQTLPIILTGRTFLADWSRNENTLQLARVMADSSMLFAGMIPWSVLAIMCSTVLDVPLLAYVPFAIFLWCLPLLTLCYSYFIQKRLVSE